MTPHATLWGLPLGRVFAGLWAAFVLAFGLDADHGATGRLLNLYDRVLPGLDQC